MNVQLLSIEPTDQIRTYHIEVKIADRSYKFTITVEIAPIAGQKIQVINGDASFLETFRFNPQVARQISRLVLDVHNGETVNIPATISEFKGEAVSFPG